MSGKGLKRILTLLKGERDLLKLYKLLVVAFLG